MAEGGNSFEKQDFRTETVIRSRARVMLTQKIAALSALSAPGAPPTNGGAASARGQSARAEPGKNPTEPPVD